MKAGRAGGIAPLATRQGDFNGNTSPKLKPKPSCAVNSAGWQLTSSRPGRRNRSHGTYSTGFLFSDPTTESFPISAQERDGGVEKRVSGAATGRRSRDLCPLSHRR